MIISPEWASWVVWTHVWTSLVVDQLGSWHLSWGPLTLGRCLPDLLTQEMVGVLACPHHWGSYNSWFIRKELLKVGRIASHLPVASFGCQHTVVLACECQWNWMVGCRELSKLRLPHQHSISDLNVTISDRPLTFGTILCLEFLTCISLAH